MVGGARLGLEGQVRQELLFPPNPIFSSDCNLFLFLIALALQLCLFLMDDAQIRFVEQH